MKTNYTDIETWTVEDLVDAVSEKPIKKRKIMVPKFQRNLVWGNEQKKSYIDSIKMGFPFGSLLLSKEKNEEDKSSPF